MNSVIHNSSDSKSGTKRQKKKNREETWREKHAENSNCFDPPRPGGFAKETAANPRAPG